MGLGDKLSELTSKFKRKSIDDKIEEVLGSANKGHVAQESFSSTFSQLNAQAADRFRNELSGMGRALFTRAEERFDTNYPAIERAPFGDASEEGPLTRNFDEAHFRNNALRNSATTVPEPHGNEKAQPPSTMEGGFSHTSPSFENNTFPARTSGNYYASSKNSTQHLGSPDLNTIINELHTIREQNAVILERLKRIEEMLSKHY